jgi:hypothetical protein
MLHDTFTPCDLVENPPKPEPSGVYFKDSKVFCTAVHQTGTVIAHIDMGKEIEQQARQHFLGSIEEEE